MDDSVRAARRMAVALIAAASVGVGLLLIWYFVRPGAIREITTPHMLVLLGLFLMPVVTLAAWEMERRARASAPADPAPHHEPMPSDAGVAARHIRHDEPAAHGGPRRLAKGAIDPRPIRRSPRAERAG